MIQLSEFKMIFVPNLLRVRNAALFIILSVVLMDLDKTLDWMHPHVFLT